MQKNTSILVITVILLFVVLAVTLLIWRSGMMGTPYSAPMSNQMVTPAPAPQDTAASISEDLKGIDVVNPDDEFKDIDSNLNNL